MDTLLVESPLFASRQIGDHAGDEVARRPEDAVLTLRQVTTGDIGTKLYPGALVMLRALERVAAGKAGDGADAVLASVLGKRDGKDEPSPVVLELGCGVAPLPSLAAAVCGARVIATDAPDMLPLLRENVAVCTRELERRGRLMPDAIRVEPCWWGDAAHVAALQDTISSLTHGTRRSAHLILAADVVYHTHLADPLLAALLALTDVHPAPPVVMSYVQRFQRAKDFFKRARRWFDVRMHPCVPLCDYTHLTWDMPALAAMARGPAHERDSLPSPPLAFTSGHTDVEVYTAMLEAAYAAGARTHTHTHTEGTGSETSHAEPERLLHGVDSDTDDEYSAGGAVTADRVFAHTSASSSAHVCEGRHTHAHMAEALGVRAPEALQAYLVVLIRKPA